MRDDAFDIERTQVFSDGKMFVENSGNKAPQVSQEPKLDVPKLDK